MIRGSHFSIDNNLSQVKFPQYKLILMDLNMPIMDGFEATQQIFQLYQ
jgi:CheY-like chemotaxis protein